MLFGLIHDVPSEKEELAYYLDSRGHVYCTKCKHGKDIQDVERKICQASAEDYDACDSCGAPLVESIEIVSGVATVEYFGPCKIF